MAFVAGPRNRQKYAPQADVGPVQPQPTNVIEAYQQGGIPGALSMIFNAPDPGIGPMAVVQKAGAAPLRPLLIKQAGQELAKWGNVGQSLRTMADVPQARQEVMKLTPMVQKTLTKLEKAETGKSLSIVGHRAESPTGPVPGRGTFFSALPTEAKSYSPGKVAEERIKRTGFIPVGRRVEPLQFKNPLVFPVGAQGGAIFDLVTGPGKNKLSTQMRKAGVALTAQRGGERWFTRADKWLARAAKMLGHDGIVYKETNEIVDLAGTKIIPKRGASR